MTIRASPGRHPGDTPDPGHPRDTPDPGHPRDTPDPGRSGIVLPIAIAIMLMLGVLALAVHSMSRQTYRGLERLDGFLRAVSVAEAGYARVVARLEAKPWGERWFKGSFATESGGWDEGTYTVLIADDSGTRADLVVRGQVEGGLLLLYWQLQPDLASLSPHRRVRSTFFTHLDPSTRVDVPGLGPIRDAVRQAQEERKRNRPWSDDHERRIAGDPRPDSLPGNLEIPGPPPPSLIPPLVDGGQPGGTGPRLDQPPDPQIPFPTLPPPPPDALIAPPNILPLVTARERLTTINDALKGLADYLESTVGEGTNPAGTPIPSSVQTVDKKLEDCCDPGAASGTPACAGFACIECKEAMDLFNADIKDDVANARIALRNCRSEVETLMQTMDREFEPPGPSDARAQELLTRAEAANRCYLENRRLVNDVVVAGRNRFGACPAAGGGAMDPLNAPVFPE